MRRTILATVVAVVLSITGTASAFEKIPEPAPLDEMVANRLAEAVAETDEITALKILPVIEAEAKEVRADWVRSYELQQDRIAAAEAAEAQPSYNASSAPVVTGGGDIYDALARCESGGDPLKNTGNGYYGAFQFLPSTWNRFHPGLPIDYSYAVQKAAAIRLIALSGWGQFPACAAMLGML